MDLAEQGRMQSGGLLEALEQISIRWMPIADRV